MNRLSGELLTLYEEISKKRKWQLLVLILLSIFVSLFEAVSLGSIVPFVGILTNPEAVYNAAYLSDIIQLLDIKSPSDLIFPLVVTFSCIVIVAGFLRITLLYFNIRLSNNIAADLSKKAFRCTLYQPYIGLISNNSSELISGVTQKVSTASGVITAIITVITSFPIFIAILVTVIFVNPLVAIVVFSLFGLVYIVLSFSVRRVLRVNSLSIANNQTRSIKILQEGLGSIRDIILDNTHEYYLNKYNGSVDCLRTAQGTNSFINQSPRFALETLGMVIIALLAYFLIKQQGSGSETVFSTLAVIVLASQRILPLLQIIYGNLTVIMSSQASLRDVNVLLNQKQDSSKLSYFEDIAFNNTIGFNNISFHYPSSETNIIAGCNLLIKKGDVVGFKGVTGGGKSTFIDLLMGLMQPTGGCILVDDEELNDKNRSMWQKKITHVPQEIYLEDKSIAENIAIGVEVNNIDQDGLSEACKHAELQCFIDNLADGVKTQVGERGVRLSGGQRQRIGIARALYKQSEILILDEATSALDNTTESSIMKAINSLDSDLTVVIIAHRLSTLSNCDIVYEIRDKTVVETSL